MADHVDSHGIEVFAVRTEIPGIGFGMATNAMQKQQLWHIRAPGAQIARFDSAGVKKTLGKAYAAQILPDAGVEAVVRVWLHGVIQGRRKKEEGVLF
jgi:hypothetical protein